MDLVTQILQDPCVLTDATEQLPPAIPTLYPPPQDVYWKRGGNADRKPPLAKSTCDFANCAPSNYNGLSGFIKASDLPALSFRLRSNALPNSQDTLYYGGCWGGSYPQKPLIKICS